MPKAFAPHRTHDMRFSRAPLRDAIGFPDVVYPRSALLTGAITTPAAVAPHCTHELHFLPALPPCHRHFFRTAPTNCASRQRSHNAKGICTELRPRTVLLTSDLTTPKASFPHFPNELRSSPALIQRQGLAPGTEPTKCACHQRSHNTTGTYPELYPRIALPPRELATPKAFSTQCPRIALLSSALVTPEAFALNCRR